MRVKPAVFRKSESLYFCFTSKNLSTFPKGLALPPVADAVIQDLPMQQLGLALATAGKRPGRYFHRNAGLVYLFPRGI